nr:MAG TPA: hypothetical protein [Caudoviricetes sp.]
MKRPSESSPESDGLRVGRVRLPCLSRFIQPSDQDVWGDLCGKVGGFAFEVQLSITEKDQYAVAYRPFLQCNTLTSLSAKEKHLVTKRQVFYS